MQSCCASAWALRAPGTPCRPPCPCARAYPFFPTPACPPHPPCPLPAPTHPPPAASGPHLRLSITHPSRTPPPNHHHRRPFRHLDSRDVCAVHPSRRGCSPLKPFCKYLRCGSMQRAECVPIAQWNSHCSCSKQHRAQRGGITVLPAAGVYSGAACLGYPTALVAPSPPLMAISTLWG